MKITANKIIHGTGMTPFGELPRNPSIFTDILVPELIELPKEKPDIDQLMSLTVESQIESTQLVPTFKGTSNEGQHLCGYKLVIEFRLRKIIKYIADEPTQRLHAIHHDGKLNSVFIVVPGLVTAGIPPVSVPVETLYKEGDLMVIPYLTDITGMLKDKRTVFTDISVFVNVRSM